jgi:uncharacterized protein YegJ (DUF2314 family)
MSRTGRNLLLLLLLLLIPVLPFAAFAAPSRFSPAREGGSPVSLVWLRTRPAPLDRERVAALLREAFDERTAKSIVVPPPREGVTAYLFTHGDAIFGIITSDRPYLSGVELEKARAGFKDSALRKAFDSHRAWMAVDLFEPDDAPRDQVEPVLGKVAAALLDEGAVLLYAPHRAQAALPRGDTRTCLSGRRPMDVFGPSAVVPVVKVPKGDPEIKAAGEEARRRWPELVSAWEKRDDAQRFFVKTAFPAGDDTEHMWIRVHALSDEKADGTLDNDPELVKGLRAGDAVNVPLAAIEDWLYLDPDGKPIGGFTTRVLEKRQKADPEKGPRSTQRP